MDESVNGRGIELEVESGASCGSSTADEVCGDASFLEEPVNFLQRCLDGARLAGASGAQEEDAQGLDELQHVLLVSVEKPSRMLQENVHEKQLVVVV